MAELPENISDRFETKVTNSAGIYLLTLFVNGIVTPVIIDDWIPVGDENKPAFSNNPTEEIWVSLLEKAWAKLHRTYARIESGYPAFAVMHLLGTPALTYYHDTEKNDKDQFW